MDAPDFYLASSEGYDMHSPRRCFRVKRVATTTRNDLLLIRIDPPLIGQSFGLGGRDIDLVIIAPRHKGASLFPINEWPVYVHVARLLAEYLPHQEPDHIPLTELEVIAWAELYRSEAEAIKSVSGHPADQPHGPRRAAD